MDIYRPHFLYRLNLVFVFLLVKLKPIHFLLPKSLRDELPIGWNNQMFWVAFKSGGKKLFFDFYCKMREADSYEPKTKVKAEYQLTEKDIRSFHENGYIGPFDLGYSAEKIERIREKLVDLATNEKSQIYSYVRGDYELVTRPKGDENGDIHLLSETQRASVSKLNQLDRYLESPLLMDLFKNPAITERCAQLLGPYLLLWHSSFFHISPLSSGTPWHQTSTWLSADMKDSLLQPPDIGDLFQVTCWIPLVDTPREKSCMTMVSGSRKEIYPVKHKIGSGEGNKVFGKYAVDLDYQVDEKNIHFLEAKAGQAIIFCERTVHGSTDNVTEDTRWSVVGRIVQPDTRIYTKKMFEDGYALETYGVKKIKLDRWKAVVIRGEDRFGYNKVRSD